MEALDGVLEQLAKKGPEFGPGLANHGPMAVDALIALGRTDVIEPWAEWYVTRLDEPPAAGNAINGDDWREALGEIARAGDWSVFFQRELAEHPWREALETWALRLLPGIMAGATHGILRTAHAVRSLERGETPQRVAEFGEGLAYWAARYQELPSAPGQARSLSVDDALALLPIVPPERRGRFLIFDAVRAIDADQFAPAVNYLDVSGEVDAFVSSITRAFVRQYLANADHAAIGFVHTVTAPSALRILAPYLGEEAVRDAMRYAWQACAAIYAAYARTSPASARSPLDGVIDVSDLIDRAVAARDEHAIKFTEACVREHGITGDALFLVAAKDATQRLRAR